MAENTYPQNEQNVFDTLLRHAAEKPDKAYLLSRFDQSGEKTPGKVHKVTYSQAVSTVRDLVKGLMELGFAQMDRLAVFGPNRPRWIYSCQAAIMSGGVHVPIYPTSKEEDVWWILHDSGAKFVVCASMSLAEKVLAVKQRVETLQGVILMDPLPEAQNEGITGFDQLLAKGRESGVSDEEVDRRILGIKEDDLAAIIYTSGTTGRPKGVMLTHKSLISQRVIEPEWDYGDNEVFLAHLPMCHSFGFSADFLNAGNIGGTLFVADSLEANEMKKNLLDARPTIMASVPRLWEKFYLQINQTVQEQPPAKKKMVSWALKVGEKSHKLRSENRKLPFLLSIQSKIADNIFAKLKSQIGMERLKYSATGGGPIDPRLIYFFGGMGIDLYQGYGLTETAPIINANTPKHNRIGTVGRPLPNVEEKIAEDGEIMVRAPQVMKGYYNNPEATAEVMTEDGWFLTGDIGEIDQDGYLKITDRKKELIITSGGKNIAPQIIENEFNTDQYIEMICAVGDDRKFISALVVPEFDLVRKWLEEQTGEKMNDNRKLIEHPKVKKLIEERIQIANRNLARYEQIKKWVVLDEPFTEETGELTPSQKKKRRVIYEKYKQQIESMYPPD